MTQHLASSQPTAAAPRTLRERLSQPGLVTAPGVYDMVSLRLADTFGFDALYMTGFGTVASHLGLPDAGLATYTDMVGRVRQMASMARTPLIADLKPGGRFLARDVYYIGGAAVILRTLLEQGLLHGDALTFTGRTLAEEVAEALKWLSQYGDARMSGSGACLFAPFDSEAEALKVAASAPSGWKVWVAQGLDRHPLKDWVAE